MKSTLRFSLFGLVIWSLMVISIVSVTYGSVRGQLPNSYVIFQGDGGGPAQLVGGELQEQIDNLQVIHQMNAGIYDVTQAAFVGLDLEGHLFQDSAVAQAPISDGRTNLSRASSW